jgi:hypothetical protein
MICPIHHRPLVRTHGGSLICIPCRTPVRKARYSTTWNGKDLVTPDIKRQQSRDHMRRMREARAQK